MKPFLILFLALVSIIGCSNHSNNNLDKNSNDSTIKTENAHAVKGNAHSSFNSHSENNIVKVKYTEPIQGFKVKILWQPKKVRYDYVVGPAIIEFYNTTNNAEFTVTTNFFSLHKERLPFGFNEDRTEITKITENVQLNYNMNIRYDKEGFGTREEPFFFKDINFDGDKELLIGEVGAGQREVTSFKVFALESDDIVDNLYQITNKEPFCSLDELSAIDYSKKTIAIYGSGGACDSETNIYRLNSSNQLVLDRVIEMKDCKNYIYEVTTQQKRKLIAVAEK